MLQLFYSCCFVKNATLHLFVSYLFFSKSECFVFVYAIVKAATAHILSPFWILLQILIGLWYNINVCWEGCESTLLYFLFTELIYIPCSLLFFLYLPCSMQILVNLSAASSPISQSGKCHQRIYLIKFPIFPLWQWSLLTYALFLLSARLFMFVKVYRLLSPKWQNGIYLDDTSHLFFSSAAWCLFITVCNTSFHSMDNIAAGRLSFSPMSA